MGNLVCCQLNSEDAQIRIENIIAEDKLFYASKKTQQLFKLKSQYDIKILKYLQANIKSRQFRTKLKREMKLNEMILKSELKANIVGRALTPILSMHLGYSLLKRTNEQLGLSFTHRKKHYKYIITFEAVYIDKLKNEDIYVGSWNLLKKFQGYGIVYKSDGSYFEGNWENGVLEGFGRYITILNEYYIGEFKRGLANGVGTFVHNNGTIYRGNWVNDVIDGEGEDTFNDGSCFKGLYSNGKKVKGKFTWEDGSYYEGAILNDLFHGQGTYVWSEGRKYSGEWVKGQMDGKGLFIYLNGSYYEGEFRCGLRNGEGKYQWNDNKSYEGGWLNGYQHGKGKYIKYGRVIEGIWIQGKLKNTLNLSSFNDYTSTYTCENNEPQHIIVNNIKEQS